MVIRDKPAQKASMLKLPYIDEPGSNAISVSSLNGKTNTSRFFYPHALDT